MSAAQATFLCALVAMLVAIAAFGIVVVRSAVRGGRATALGLFGDRTEHMLAGRAAFFLHRISGFGVFAFLCLHILDVGLDGISHRVYDEVQPLYGSAPLRVLECGLLFAVLFHTGNGLRLIAIDLLRVTVARAAQLLKVVVAISLTGGLAGSVVILSPLFR